MSKESLKLSWPGVFRYAWRAVKKSWVALLSGTAAIAVLAVLIPWGGVYGFTESGWDRVMGGNAVWSLLAIPVWLLIVGAWYLIRAPMGHAREVLAAHGQRLEGVQQDLTTARYELERERAAAPVFGEAVVPQHIEGRLIRLASLPPGLWLSENVLEGCQIVGPAKVLIVGCRTNDNNFYGVSKKTFVVVSNLEDHFADAIIFRNCRVSHCQFHNVTVIGTDEQINALKAGMSGDVP